MTPGRVRVGRVVTAIVVMLAAATALAQRGGYQGYRGSYSGNVRYDGRFVFTRISYPDNGRGMPHWSHDYPAGELHFMQILSNITDVPSHVNETSIMAPDDPELFKFPVAYMCEPGYWSMSDPQVVALRAYLQKGGFIIFDDFRGGDWGYMDLQMSRVFPDLHWVDLEISHPIFHSFFEINSIDIIPQYYDRGRPIFRALFEDNDPKKRMIAMANYNTDISEFWEWSNSGFRPIDENNEAYKLGVNEFIYAITH